MPDLGRIFRVPVWWKGSVRYYQNAYAQCMAICHHFGNPDLLITFTGSADWPEIKSKLSDGQNTADIPDIVCRVFMDKLENLKRDIFQRHVLGPIKAGFLSIEHQKGYVYFKKYLFFVTFIFVVECLMLILWLYWIGISNNSFTTKLAAKEIIRQKCIATATFPQNFLLNLKAMI
jgi:hypothetical protein